MGSGLRPAFAWIAVVVLALPAAIHAQTDIRSSFQCGGRGGGCVDGTNCIDAPWPGATCSQGLTCIRDNTWWWHCGRLTEQGALPGTLIWSEEFSGNTINPNTWNFEQGDGTAYPLTGGWFGWGNDEKQCYTSSSQNAGIVADPSNPSNSLLQIAAIKQPGSTCINYNPYTGGTAPSSTMDWTSAKLTTCNKKTFMWSDDGSPVYIEARTKGQLAQGTWKAFWFLPQPPSPYGGWPSSGEIDVYEHINQDTSFHFNVNYGRQWWVFRDETTWLLSDPGEWHTWAIEWAPEYIAWIVDGYERYRSNRTSWWTDGAPNKPGAPYDMPFYVLLNMAIDGYPNRQPNSPPMTDGPFYYWVDYIRAYTVPRTTPYVRPSQPGDSPAASASPAPTPSPTPSPTTSPSPSPSPQPSPPPSPTALPIYSQCGGTGGGDPPGTGCVAACQATCPTCTNCTGGTCMDSPWPGFGCAAGLVCSRVNVYWWQCAYGSAPSVNPQPSPSLPPAPSGPPSPTSLTLASQCGGTGGGDPPGTGCQAACQATCPTCTNCTGGICMDAPWGNFSCAVGLACNRVNIFWWQCQQVAAAPFTEAPSTCPPAPSPSSGACPTDTTPATASLSTASLNLTYTQCLPAASVQYDAFTRRFAFSTLLSLACLPSAFRNVPFTLSVLGITRGVSDMPPGAAATLSIEALKPATVGISLFLTPPATTTTTTTSTLGPWSSDQASMTLPSGGVASIGIRITVPADQQLLDGAAVGAEIQVLAPTPSPAPSPSPGASSSGSAAAALTPGSPVLAATFVVLRDISHSADLQLNAVQRSQADGSVYTRSMGYVMLVGLAFKDFAQLRDCSSTSQAAFLASLSANLGVPSANLTATCTYTYASSTSGRRALQQSGCGFSPRVTLRIRMQLGTAATNTSLSSTTNLQRVLEGLYTPSSACVFLAWRYAVTAAFRLQPAASRRQALEAQPISTSAGSTAGAAGQALKLPACQPISASAVSAAGAEGQVELPACQPAATGAHPDHGRRVLTTAAPQSNCQALITSSLGLQASEVTSLTCSQGMASEYGLTDQSGGGGAAASNAGVIAGAVIGVVVGLALIAAGVAAAFILHKRRQAAEDADAASKGELDGPIKPVDIAAADAPPTNPFKAAFFGRQKVQGAPVQGPGAAVAVIKGRRMSSDSSVFGSPRQSISGAKVVPLGGSGSTVYTSSGQVPDSPALNTRLSKASADPQPAHAEASPRGYPDSPVAVGSPQVAAARAAHVEDEEHGDLHATGERDGSVTSAGLGSTARRGADGEARHRAPTVLAVSPSIARTEATIPDLTAEEEIEEVSCSVPEPRESSSGLLSPPGRSSSRSSTPPAVSSPLPTLGHSTSAAQRARKMSTPGGFPALPEHDVLEEAAAVLHPEESLDQVSALPTLPSKTVDASSQLPDGKPGEQQQRLFTPQASRGAERLEEHPADHNATRGASDCTHEAKGSGASPPRSPAALPGASGGLDMPQLESVDAAQGPAAAGAAGPEGADAGGDGGRGSWAGGPRSSMRASRVVRAPITKVEPEPVVVVEEDADGEVADGGAKDSSKGAKPRGLDKTLSNKTAVEDSRSLWNNGARASMRASRVGRAPITKVEPVPEPEGDSVLVLEEEPDRAAEEEQAEEEEEGAGRRALSKPQELLLSLLATNAPRVVPAAAGDAAKAEDSRSLWTSGPRASMRASKGASRTPITAVLHLGPAGGAEPLEPLPEGGMDGAAARPFSAATEATLGMVEEVEAESSALQLMDGSMHMAPEAAGEHGYPASPTVLLPAAARNGSSRQGMRATHSGVTQADYGYGPMMAAGQAEQPLVAHGWADPMVPNAELPQHVHAAGWGSAQPSADAALRASCPGDYATIMQQQQYQQQQYEQQQQQQQHFQQQQYQSQLPGAAELDLRNLDALAPPTTHGTEPQTAGWQQGGGAGGSLF